MVRNYIALQYMFGSFPTYFKGADKVLEKMGVPSMCYFEQFRQSDATYQEFILSYRTFGPQGREAHFTWSSAGYFDVLWLVRTENGDEKVEGHTLDEALVKALGHIEGCRKVWPSRYHWSLFIRHYQMVTGIRFNREIRRRMLSPLKGTNLPPRSLHLAVEKSEYSERF